MKYAFLYLLTLSSFVITTNGQSFKKGINKDSLFQVILNDQPAEMKAELIKLYNGANDQSKEFMIVMLLLPKSSKKELIENIDNNFDKITLLKTSYLTLVPKGFTVSIEFNPENSVLISKESIDLKIENHNNNQRDFKQEWNLEYNSNKLIQMIKPLNWTLETLKRIKELLSGAKCVSIENGEITTIGFARSGMGKYYFKLFDSDLTPDQIIRYNNGCTYIFYKKNIVLEYGSGAVGSDCFPDK